MLLPRLSARRRGLSLLEVLVAMAIFLLAFSALWHLLTLASANALVAHHRSQAARIAQSKLHLALAGMYWPPPSPPAEVGPMDADDDDPGIQDDGDLSNYSWWIVVNQTNPDSAHPFAANVYQIEVHVKLKQEIPGRPPVEVVLTQVIMDPTWYATSMDAVLPLSSTNTPSNGYTIPNGPPTSPIGASNPATGSSSGGN